MQFRLRVLNNGKEETWYYDNLQNVVLDSKKVNRFESLRWTHLKSIKLNGADTEFKYNETIRTLYISLGLKCNFHCKYCYQTNLCKSKYVDASPSKVSTFIQLIKDSGLQLEKEQSDIILYGGEPLVYWKTLKLLIPELRKLFPDTKISFITNGSLLTKEVCDFCLEYKVGFTVSYDGQHTLRDYPVFNDPKIVEIYKYAMEIGVEVAVLPLVANGHDLPTVTEKELCKKFNRKINIGYHSIFKCSSETDAHFEIGALPEKQQKEYIRMLEEALKLPLSEMEGSLLSRLNEIRFSIVHGIPPYSTRAACCNATGNILSVDFDGNIITCMNYPDKKWGSIKNYRTVKITDYYSPLNHKACRECPYLNICLGACPLIKDEHSEAFKINCTNFKCYAIPMFQKTIESLFGVKLLEVL